MKVTNQMENILQAKKTQFHTSVTSAQQGLNQLSVNILLEV